MVVPLVQQAASDESQAMIDAVVNADTINPRYGDGQRMPERETDLCISICVAQGKGPTCFYVDGSTGGATFSRSP